MAIGPKTLILDQGSASRPSTESSGKKKKSVRRSKNVTETRESLIGSPIKDRTRLEIERETVEVLDTTSNPASARGLGDEINAGERTPHEEKARELTFAVEEDRVREVLTIRLT